MISFELTDDQQLVQETVRAFAREVVRPNLRVWERAGAVSDEARRRFHELGVGLIDLPEALGGGGQGALTAALVHEELAFGDAGAAVELAASHTAAAAIVELGDPAQARRLLAPLVGDAQYRGAVAYSEKGAPPVAGFATTAERQEGGYLLRGSKAFVVGGGADLTVAFAQLEPGRGWQGVAAFAASRTPALRAGERHRLLGLETVSTCHVLFDGVLVQEEDRLLGGGDLEAAVARWLGRVALMNAARQVGLARAAYEQALHYTQERHAFGKPVAHFQAIAFALADMLMAVESARWMVWHAATHFDEKKSGGDALAAIAQAAVHANQAAWQVADQAVQLFGGAGYVQDFPVEKWLRDTQALALFAPPDEHQQLRAAGMELGHALASVWPTTALQPMFT